LFCVVIATNLSTSFFVFWSFINLHNSFKHKEVIVLLMITSIDDYRYYQQADRIALDVRKPSSLQEFFVYHFWNEIWKFEKLL
jgi:hypothetical protein